MHIKRPTRSIVTMLGAMLVTAPAGYGADQIATWNGTSGNWSDANEWSTTNYPDNGNGGIATYDAEIIDGFGDVSVTLDVDVTIEGFTFDAVAGNALTRSADLTVNDTFDWLDGDISGSGTLTLASGSTSNVSAGNVNIRDGEIVNHGTFNKTSSARLLFRDAVFTNNGTADAQSDGSFIERNSFASSATTFVDNTGTFLKSAGTGDTIIDATKFNNSGTVEVQTGRLGFARGFAGASPGYTQTAGMLNLNGGDVFADDVAMDIQGGSIQGEGTISGDIDLAGTIAPGTSIGTLTLDDNAVSAEGDLTFASGGEYAAELGTPGSADLLDLTGTLDLTTSGAVLSLSGGQLGETYTIANYDSVASTFDSVTPGYTPDYGPNSLEVTVVPEPTTVALLGLGGLAMLPRRCRRYAS